VNPKLRIGTRGSKLALWQAHFTQEKLAAMGVESELIIIKTTGDQIQHLSFDKIEGKGFFTKEIEEALLRGEIDLAVHSMKDLPTNAPEGLVISAVSYRDDPADILLINKKIADSGKLLHLPENAKIGTSSSRRKGQLLDLRADLQLLDIRGNVPTRIQKLAQGDFDAIILASAGVNRLNIDVSSFKIIRFDPSEIVPAPAQGVLAWQTMADDIQTRKILKGLHHSEVADVTNVERKVLNLMNGGCQMPLGVYCYKDALGNYHIHAAYSPRYDLPMIRVSISSATHYQLAEKVVEKLRS
jgi:hydroxymethylbilane synthase